LKRTSLSWVRAAVTSRSYSGRSPGLQGAILGVTRRFLRTEQPRGVLGLSQEVVLSAEELIVGEKHDLITQVIEVIYPEGDGYRSRCARPAGGTLFLGSARCVRPRAGLCHRYYGSPFGQVSRSRPPP
jgi:hypothetical protein